MKKHLLWVLVLEGFVGLYRTVQLQLHQRYSLGHTVILNGFPWKTNIDHSVIFEIVSKYCILDSFVDYDGYSISSREFLTTILDIMVIRVKFTHSSLF